MDEDASQILPARSSSPGDRVIGIPELLEQILLPLPIPDLILRIPLVSRTFHAVATTTPSLRRKAFRSPDPNARYSNFPVPARAGINLQLSLSNHSPTSFSNIWCGIKYTDPDNTLARGLGRHLICQPPLQRCYLDLRINTYGMLERSTVQFQREEGLTFGDLFHELARVREGLEREGVEIRKNGLLTVTIRPFGNKDAYENKVRRKKRKFLREERTCEVKDRLQRSTSF